MYLWEVVKQILNSTDWLELKPRIPRISSRTELFTQQLKYVLRILNRKYITYMTVDIPVIWRNIVRYISRIFYVKRVVISAKFDWQVILENKIVKMLNFVASAKFTCLENLYVYGIWLVS